MADLARLKRMAPFRDMSGAEFRAMVDEFRTLMPRAASGATGQITTPRGTAIRTMIPGPVEAVAPPMHIGKVCQKAVHFGAWGREYADCQRLMIAPTDHTQTPIFETDAFTRVYMYPPGQAYTIGNYVLMFKVTFPDDSVNPTAWIGCPLIQVWKWAAGQYWTEPDCDVEECGEDILPDDDPIWPIGDCG